MQFLIIIVILLALMWLLLIRPQRRRQQQQAQLLGNVVPGDEILTAGGLYGTVRAVKDDEVALEIAPGTEVRVAKRAVAAIIPPPTEDEELEEGEEPEEIEEAEKPEEIAAESSPRGESHS